MLASHGSKSKSFVSFTVKSKADAISVYYEGKKVLLRF